MSGKIVVRAISLSDAEEIVDFIRLDFVKVTNNYHSHTYVHMYTILLSIFGNCPEFRVIV